MLKVGITGGIGSGKSVVCRVFATLGIPVFNADDASRYLMEHDAAIISAVKAILGHNVYKNGLPDRPAIAHAVYNSPVLLQQLNALMHPATIQAGRQWMERQATPYVIKEAAIFFESGTYIDMDVMVGVYAPAPLRLQRAMARGNVSSEKITNIMTHQMDEDEKMRRCHHIITNDDITAVLPQVLQLHSRLLAQAAKSTAL